MEEIDNSTPSKTAESNPNAELARKSSSKVREEGELSSSSDGDDNNVLFSKSLTSYTDVSEIVFH